MTLAQALAYPNSRKVLLAAITAGKRLVGWTNDGTYTNTWRVQLGGLRVTAVSENGTALTARASAALCNTNDGSWFWDETADRLYVNPTASNANASVIVATVGVGVGTFGKTPRGIGADQVYWGRLLGVPELSLRIPDRFGEVGQVGGGTLTVANGDGWAERLGELDWDAGQVSLKLGVDTF